MYSISSSVNLFFLLLYYFLTNKIVFLDLSSSEKINSKITSDKCFCELRGEIDDCSCTIESVDYFNNLKVYPRISSLIRKNYFKYFKVNLKKQCPFWSDDGRCSLRDCHVDKCSKDSIPSGLRKKKNNDTLTKTEQSSDECKDELGYLNQTISDASKKAFKIWRKHDDAQENFCELDDTESLDDTFYVDLILNPERYTGYKGSSPRRIWKSIYQENCFKPDKKTYKNVMTKGNLDAMCLEKRVFYRIISGLHTSINIHLSSMFFHPSKSAFEPGSWGPNIAEFKQRFDPVLTKDEGTQRLQNLYLLYLVEMRALVKASSFLEKELFYTGEKTEDLDVKVALKDFFSVLNSFSNHFDETKLFRGDPKEAKLLKQSFKTHFRNISRIMDCVGCDKCKLWGKLQVTGIGTALKILFSGDSIGPNSKVTPEGAKLLNFQLNRTEIVALFNSFARLSESIFELETFRKLLNSNNL